MARSTSRTRARPSDAPRRISSDSRTMLRLPVRGGRAPSLQDSERPLHDRCRCAPGGACTPALSWTRRTLHEAFDELLCQPLGMDRSTYFARDAITYATVSGHDLVDGTLRVMRHPWSPIPRASNPVGGIISSIRDVLRYARFLAAS